MDDELNSRAVILLEQAGTDRVTDEVSICSVEYSPHPVEASPKRGDRLSLAAMRRLHQNIRKLNSGNLAGMVRILKDYDPVRFRSNDELWFYIDKLDMELLFKLRQFIRTCKWRKIRARVNSHTSTAKPDQNMQLAMVPFNPSVIAQRVDIIDLTKEDELEIPIFNWSLRMIGKRKKLIKNGERVDIYIC